MKQASLLLLVVAFAFAVSPLYAEVWVMATGHTHTYYSDGGNSIVTVGRRALATGSRFCAITDHVEAIETRKVGMLNVWQDVKFFGMADWIEDVRVGAAILHREGLDLVPGGEGALDTRPEGLMGANHVVMMGGPIAIYGQMQKLVIQSGDPDLMASRLHELASAGAVLIAAHPNCSAYKFDKALLKWVDAVEIFDGTADPLSELRVVASHPEAKSRTLAVVTGSDFHADDVSRLDTLGKAVRLKPVEMARAANPLARHIWAPVSSPKATREELIEAIKQRRTYASIAPARIVTAKTMPGGRHDTREVLGMRLDGMNWALGRSVHCLLVRRGSGDVRELEVPISVTGDTTGDFLLDFVKLPPAVLRDGSFLYLMVANQIATSGIELAPRPDIVVAKKRGFLEQAGDLLGQVAEVLNPTVSATSQEGSASPTPSSLDISGTWVGSGAYPDGSWPCRVVSSVTRRRDGTFLFITVYTWNPPGGRATVQVSRRLLDTGVVQDVARWAVSGTSPSGQSPYKTGGVLKLAPDGVLVFSHPGEPLVTQYRLCRQ